MQEVLAKTVLNVVLPLQLIQAVIVGVKALPHPPRSLTTLRPLEARLRLAH